MTDVAGLCAHDGSWVERSVIADPELYRLEQRRIFDQTWSVVAHESQIPTSGSFVSSWIGESPVLVCRRRDGEISVVLNSCAHRGSRVCRVDQGDAGSFTCPNHGWSFANDGQLLGVPHQGKGYAKDQDRADLGLVAARVASRFGIVFATFELDPPTIGDHLGDAEFYLETVFDRYAAGTRVLDGTLRSRVSCNWKLAMENLGTDLQHPEFAHRAFLELWPDPIMEFMGSTEQVLTDAGHPACVGHRPPPYTEADHVLSSIDDAAERREVGDWFDKTNREARDRLGAERAEFYVFTGSIFPNFSFLPGVSAAFVLTPKGASETEWWSWCLEPVGAPAAVLADRRRNFMMASGPGGLILAEDAENWADMTRLSRAEVGHRRRLRIDRGMGDEYVSDGLPGTAAPMRSEHVQRGFWLNWRKAMVG